MGTCCTLYVQLDDVGVPEQLQVLDLALNAAGHVSGDEALAIDDFQRHLLAADLVRGQLDLAEGALAEGAYNGVLAEALVCLCVLALGLVDSCAERSGRHWGGVLGLWGAGPSSLASPLGGHGDGELLQVLVVDGGGHGGRGLAGTGLLYDGGAGAGDGAGGGVGGLRVRGLFM